ncbi:cysteine hydrolase family protein [Paenibacillus sp. UNC499MF]|uniref:cysteine hydrolase family protein n=1 Tax=Paenibacillus sp. UNC499MF TaxID=1502751 RepID=UPI00089FDECC|nr:isochorismatase family cysteine hydrolase [Paenibacillus sp. UNC499MF]SEF46006.1 Nicotinamidase-related amidase [Paenibacillus sp. UNC499MF]
MSRYVQPNLAACALLTIDTQNDFSLPGAPAEIPGTNEVLPVMSRILEQCRTSGIPVIHVIRIYERDGSNADLCRKEMIEAGAAVAAPGSRGADLADAIKPAQAEELRFEALLGGEIQAIGEREWVLYKPRWGAFYNTKLEDFLKERGIDTLIFTGCNFPNCPRTSMYEASERDFKAIMVEDAISGVYEKGKEEIRHIGISIYDSASLIRDLGQALAQKCGPSGI